jgi:hypothetical protein
VWPVKLFSAAASIGAKAAAPVAATVRLTALRKTLYASFADILKCYDDSMYGKISSEM